MRVPLREILAVFFKLGATGFGGPVALIALMEKECSARRQWLSREEFERAYVFCKLMPGPVAYQMALWIGNHLGGRFRGFLAGATFLFPSVVLMLLLSHFYGQVKSVPQFSSVMEGMRAGAIVVIADSVWRMLAPYRKESRAWAFIGGAVLLMFAFPRWEPLIILAGGLSMVIARKLRDRPVASLALLPILEIFWVHFKAGAFVFGTGLAVIPVLEAEVVSRGWLTTGEFLDGIAFGQITPGPVTITSVFIGHVAGGFPGAFAALFGMYLPGILLILGIMPLVFRRIEGKRWLLDFQAGAVPMVIGCILGALIGLARVTVTTPSSLLIVVLLSLVVAISKTPSWTLLPVGGALSFIGTILW